MLMAHRYVCQDVAHIQIGPELRRGIVELNGEGEVAAVCDHALWRKRPGDH